MQELSKEDDEDTLWSMSIGKRMKDLNSYQKALFRQKVESSYIEVRFPQTPQYPINQLQGFNYDTNTTNNLY